MLCKNKFRIASTRLPDWDYSSPGYYFITICVKNRVCCLGKINNGQIILSTQGKIATDYWFDLKNHYTHVALDAFVVMPNRIHGIMEIKNNNTVETIHDHAQPPEHAPAETIHELSLPQLKNDPKQRRKMLLSKIIGRFNMQSSKQINLLQNTAGHPFWQSRCFDHVIRNKKTLNKIRQHIVNHPVKWAMDKYNPEKRQND